MSSGSKSLEVSFAGTATTAASSVRLPIEEAVVHCAACGQACSISDIWCSRCQAPNKSASAELVGNDTISISERISLYEQFLRDLQGPAVEPLPDPQASQVVQAYCESQLQGLREALQRAALREARQSLVARVKSAAHRPDFQAALELCLKPTQLPPDDPVVQKLREQVETRLACEQKAARIAAEALALQRTAERCLLAGQLAEAVAKLKAALELQPGDQASQKLLREAEQRFVEQVLPAEVPAPSPSPVPTAARWVEAKQVVPASTTTEEADGHAVAQATAPGTFQPATAQPVATGVAAAPASPLVAPAIAPQEPAAASHSFAEAEEVPSPTQRHIEAFSQWTSLIKPFLLDNVGWFVGAFLVVAGFIVLIVTFWNTIEQNQILLHSLVYGSTLVTTGLFFALAYFMRLKYPRLENSSDTLLVIVALLIPLVFAAAVLTALIPASVPAEATGHLEQVRAL